MVVPIFKFTAGCKSTRVLNAATPAVRAYCRPVTGNTWVKP